jgi:hypothetical protein
MSPDPKIDGFLSPDFETVRKAFATEPRGGSALTIRPAGPPVVDLRGGSQDAPPTLAWGRNSGQRLFGGQAGDRAGGIAPGRTRAVEPERPDAAALAAIQDHASVREILAHTAGLPVFPVVREARAWSDWDLCRSAHRSRRTAPAEWQGSAAMPYDPNRNLAIGYCTRRLGGFATEHRIEAALNP